MQSTIVTKGHNLKASQFGNQGIVTENSRHTIQTFNPTSNASFGSSFQFDIKTKNYKFNEIVLGFLIDNITGVTGGSGAYLVPPDFLIQRIELSFAGGQVLQNLYADSNFILNQLMVPDEQRAIFNSFDNYKTTANRITRSAGPNWHYIRLRTLFSTCQLPVLTNGHEFSIRIFMNNVTDCINMNSGTGTPVCNILQSQLIARVSQIGTQEANEINKTLIAKPVSYLFHDYKIGVFPIASGVSSSLFTLSQITGNITCLFFVIRPTTYSKDGNFSFTEIKDFSILSAGGENIVGGSPVSSVLSLTQLSKWWCASSYLSEAYGEAVSNSFVYMWSYSSDTVQSVVSGKMLGSRAYTGFEQLQISYKNTTSVAMSCTVYALQANLLVQNIQSVTKQTAL
jgi:hypothetical protein